MKFTLGTELTGLQIFHLAEELRTRGHQVTLVAYPHPLFDSSNVSSVTQISLRQESRVISRIKGFQSILESRGDVLVLTGGLGTFRAFSEIRPESKIRALGAIVSNGLLLPLSFLELLIYRVVFRTVIAIYVGSDARGQFETEVRVNPEFKRYSIFALFSRFFRIANLRIATLCNLTFFLNPDLRSFLPKKSKFMPYISQAGLNRASRNNQISGPLNFVHGPTNPTLKGTSKIMETLRGIERKNSRVRISLINGLSHDDFLSELSRADVFIDQLVIGWFGLSSVEALLSGARPIARIDPPHDSLEKEALRMSGVWSVSAEKFESDILRLIDEEVAPTEIEILQAKEFFSPKHVTDLLLESIAEELTESR